MKLALFRPAACGLLPGLLNLGEAFGPSAFPDAVARWAAA